MPPTISINGVSYIRSRDAARIVNLAPDYVSRLARGGLIQGHQLNRICLVNLPSLKAFIAEQDRHKAMRRANLARQRREEQRLAGHPSALFA